jgi:hypothetical protein
MEKMAQNRKTMTKSMMAVLRPTLKLAVVNPAFELVDLTAQYGVGRPKT